MFIKAAPVAAEEERRGSVSNWFSSLRRGGRRKRDDNGVPTGYGSLGRRKEGAQARGKTRSAWDLTTVTRLVCIVINFTICQWKAFCMHATGVWSFGSNPNALDRSRFLSLRVKRLLQKIQRPFSCTFIIARLRWMLIKTLDRALPF